MLKANFGTAESEVKKHIGTDHSFCRGPSGRINPDLSDSAPKVADLADFWPYFRADFPADFH